MSIRSNFVCTEAVLTVADYHTIAHRVLDRHGFTGSSRSLPIETMHTIGRDFKGELEAAAANEEEIVAFLLITITNISRDRTLPLQQRGGLIDSLCDEFGWSVEYRGAGARGPLYFVTRRRIH
jgi:hypothetical protein